MARSHVLVLLLVILALFALKAYADVFLSIDCGASRSYTDNNSLIWQGDDTFVQQGRSEVVQNSNSVSPVMNTLRVFSSRKKNCYAVPADKGDQVLVRASFFYGNYDNSRSPPSFDMHFDGNFWVTVQTSIDRLVYYEVIYVTKSNSISVCLAQTQPDQFPFISALEFRTLDSNMYSSVGSDVALFLLSRVAYGASETVRYMADPYDRIWVPARVGNGFTVITSQETFINNNIADRPPKEVLQNAIRSTGNSIINLIPALPTTEIPIYINLYFSEVTQLETTQNRSFQVYINNGSVSDTISPPYAEVEERTIYNISASANTTFSLVPTADSTLPPLINAAEFFAVSDPLTDGTNSNDVNGLGQWQTLFTVLQDWSGDPCLPSPYTWDWLNCSSGAIPRVTALHLGSFDLSGPLPDFSSMDALETIDLHNNSIIGEIPDFLGNFPNLKELNLADNAFSGAIPSSISNNRNLKLVVSGNPNLCVSGNSCETTGTVGSLPATPSGGRKKKSSKLPAILGSIIPTSVILWAVGLWAVLRHKRKKAALAAGQAGGANKPNEGRPLAHGSPVSPVVGRFGEDLVNEIQVNIQEQVATQIINQVDPQAQNGSQQTVSSK